MNKKRDWKRDGRFFSEAQHAQMYHLAHNEHMSYADIAREAGCHPNAVREIVLKFQKRRGNGHGKTAVVGNRQPRTVLCKQGQRAEKITERMRNNRAEKAAHAQRTAREQAAFDIEYNQLMQEMNSLFGITSKTTTSPERAS